MPRPVPARRSARAATLCATLYAALALLPACRTGVPAAPPVPASAPSDDVPRLAIVSAFEAELARLRAAARITGTRVIDGRTHWLGTLEGHDVVLMLSGFSMVNAAMTTEALLGAFDVRAIVFSGIAGGVNPSLRVGDVTVPARWANYQEFVFARDTGGGFDAGRLAGELPAFGMMFPRGTSVIADPAVPDSLTRRLWFDADSALLEVAREAAAQVALARCAGDGGDFRSDTTGGVGACLSHQPRVVVGGRGVSGPTFVDNAAYREYAWRTFGADALDMETAAVAIVAHHHRVPFVAFRSLSDLAGGGDGANEVPVFGRLAAVNAAEVVRAFLRALPPGTPVRRPSVRDATGGRR